MPQSVFCAIFAFFILLGAAACSPAPNDASPRADAGGTVVPDAGGGAQPVGLTLSGPTAALSVGERVTLSAYVAMSDGSRVDVTSFADFQSSDPSIAGAGASGVVTAYQPGAVTITASLRSEEFGTVSASLEVRVSEVSTASLRVSPSTLRLAVGGKQQLTVVAVGADGSEKDVTSRVDYRPANTAVARVDGGGLLVATAPGETIVTVEYATKVATATVRVAAPEVVALELSPSVANLEIGARTSLQATARLDDGTSRDVTAQAAWSVDDTAIVRVSSGGEVSALGAGVGRVTATYEGRSASVTVTVTPVRVVSLTVSPTTLSVFTGEMAQLAALAYFSDGTMAAVTGRVAWSVDDPSVASVSAAGEVVGLSAGSGWVTATLGAYNARAEVIVRSASSGSYLTVSPSTIALGTGESAQLTAYAKTATGGARTVTTEAQWVSSSDAVATVDRFGRVVGVGAGSASITASHEGRIATAWVTVASANGALLSFAEAPTFDFGELYPPTATRTATLRNSGSSSAILGEMSGAALFGTRPFALSGGTCMTGAVVGAGSSCSLGLQATTSAAWIDGSLEVSYTGGSTTTTTLALTGWSPWAGADAVTGIQIGAQPAEARAPSVAVHSNGQRTVVAWTKITSATTADVFARVADAEGNWLFPTVSVATGALFTVGRPPVVDAAIAFDNRFMVVHDGLPNPGNLADIGVYRYNADGSAAYAVTVLGISNRYEFNPSLSLSTTGRPVVAYDQATSTLVAQRSNVVAYASFDNDASNTTTSISTVGGEVFPAVGFVANGGYFLASGTETGLNPLRFFNSVGNLTPSVTVAAGGTYTGRSRLTSCGSDTAYLSYYRVDGQSSLVVRSVDHGGNIGVAPTLGTETTLATNVVTTGIPNVVCMSDGTFRAVYAKDNGPARELIFARFDAQFQPISTTVLASDVVGDRFAITPLGGPDFAALVARAKQTEFGAADTELVDCVGFLRRVK